MNYRDLILESYFEDDYDDMYDSYDEDYEEYEDDEDFDYDDAYLEGYMYALQTLDENALEDAIAQGLAVRDKDGKVHMKKSNQHGASKKTKKAIADMTANLRDSVSTKSAGVRARQNEMKAAVDKAVADEREKSKQTALKAMRTGRDAGYAQGTKEGIKQGTAEGMKQGKRTGRIQGAAVGAGAGLAVAAGAGVAAKIASDKAAWKKYKTAGGKLGFTEWLKSGKPSPSVTEKGAAAARSAANAITGKAAELKEKVMKEAYEDAFMEAYEDAYEEAFLEAYYGNY